MPGRVRVPGRIMTTASADVPMKGLHPAARGARQGPDRAAGGPSRGRRPAEGRQRRFRACWTGSGLNGAVRFLSGVTDQGDRRALCRGRAGGRAVAVRGILAARRRGDGLRRPARRHHRRGAARGRRHGAASRPCSCRRTIRAPSPRRCWRRSRTRSCAAGSAPPGRKRTLERFTWPVTARGTAEQYLELLGSRPGPASC